MSVKRGLLLLAALAFLIAGGIVVYETTNTDEFYEETQTNIQMLTKNTNGEIEPDVPAPLPHVPLPEEVRGMYWTAVTARTARAEELLSYMKATGLNSVVIDIKMDNGELVWPPEELLPHLEAENIYRIARIAMMRDSAFAFAHPDVALHTTAGTLWRDKTGAGWLDPAATAVSDEAIALGREAYARGFDEVQFDYVRFASDGSLASIVYPVYDHARSKRDVMADFFLRVGSAMFMSGIPVSFDVFGMTFETTNDFGIGQRLTDVFPFADFVSPMVYPSHYATNFQGYANPALYPYEVVSHSLNTGVGLVVAEYNLTESEVRPHVRPWLQDFDMGAVYTAGMIEAQIKAARDAGASGWILWNARNVYEPADYTISN